MKTREVPWGVVQEFAVEADTDHTLTAAMSILMSYHSTISHFRVEVDDKKTPFIRLLWADDSKPTTRQFLTPLKTAEQIAAELRRWLDDTAYPSEKYTGDGSAKKGFRVEAVGDGWSYTFAIVRPVWIIYSK